MTGDFCTACGTPAKTVASSPTAGAPLDAAAAAPAGPRKTSPLVWILVAVAGVFVLFGLLVVGAGIFVAHKAKQAGLDTELMRNNPGLATAKLLAATNPDLEVVSSDDARGLITLRQKSTGKTVTVNFDDMKRGKFSFTEDGKDTVSIEAKGNGPDGSVQMKSGTESVTMGANAAKFPAWIPAYPNSAPVSVFSMSGKQGNTANFTFQTQDAPKDVIAYYEKELKRTGLTIKSTTTTDSGTSAGGFIMAEDDAGKRKVQVTVGNNTADKGTGVSVTYEEK